MSSAVARPIRSSSKKFTSSTSSSPSLCSWFAGIRDQRRSDFLDAANAFVRPPGKIDPQLLSCAEDLVVGLLHLERDPIAGQHLHIETERLELLQEHLEGLRNAGLGDVLALHHGLVDLHAPQYVVGLDGQQFLQGVRGAVRLHRPALHLAEPLAAELRLTTQRLLGDHGVRTRGPCVDLVVHQVVQLQDVDVAHRDRLGERLATTSVVQLRLAVATDQLATVAVGQRRGEQPGDLVLLGTVEHRRREVGVRLALGDVDRLQRLLPLRVGALYVPAGLRDPAQVRLQDLADVHPARHTERVEHDVDRRAVLEERHVLDRQDLGDDTLVAVPAGELVAVLDLPLLGDVHPYQLVDPGGQLVAVVPAEGPYADHRAGFAVRHLEAGVAYLPGLFTEDGAQQALLRRQLGLALGRDLADQDVARHHLGADPDDPALVEVREHLLGDVRDLARDLLRAELRVPGVDLVLLDVDRGEYVLLHQSLGQDDGVLVVVAFPGHERDQQVLAERHLTVVGARPVGDHLAGFHPVALVDHRLLVDAAAGVGAAELVQQVRTAGAVVLVHRHVVGTHVFDHAGHLGHHHVTGVGGGPVLHTGADQRRLALEQRHRLALHVRAHQCPVGVVVLEERDHRGRDRHHLPRRDVHVVDPLRCDVVDLAALPPYEDPGLGEPSVGLQRRVGLRDDVPVLLVRGQVVHLVGDPPGLNLAVRSLDEPERVHPGEGRQRADQTDVRTLGGLDRAHPAVVRRVHVAHLEAGPLPGQTARAERGQPPPMGQTRQRVGLVHELRQLRRTEELLDRSHHGADVDQGLRRDRLDVLRGHPLADHPLHPGETDPYLVLGVLLRRRLAGTQLAVDVKQRLVLAGEVVLLQRGHHQLGPAEPFPDLLRGPTDRLEQYGDRLATLPVDPYAERVALVDVELQPGTTTRDHLHAGDVPVTGLVGLLVEVDAGRADQLAHHDPLGAVDDEGALAGHHREVTEEHGLALDLASLVVGEFSGYV